MAPQPEPLIYLATSSEFPLEPNADTLIPTLTQHGLQGRWVIWNDPVVDWGKPDFVAIRSTWDYQDHLADFLAWAEKIGDRLHHDLKTVRWNTDKSYLLDLEKQGVPIVPTKQVQTEAALRKMLSEAPRSGAKQVVKPAIGASGVGVEVVEPELIARGGLESWSPSSPGPWVVQPFVDSVLTEGETSVFMIDGQMTIQFEKRAVAGEFRVHEERGGKTTMVPLSDEAEGVAYRSLEATENILGRKLEYARLDLLRWRGRLVVSEVEITEPQLYFDRIPRHGELFAKMVARLIAERTTSKQE